MRINPLSKQVYSTAALALLLSFVGHAQKSLQGPYFVIAGGNEVVEAFPLLSTDVNVDINGPIADVRVTQTYKNDGTLPIEATYLFPSSTRSAVHGMRMKIGERVIEARIDEREKAKSDYEKATSEGKAASLLEQKRPNVFQLSVSNIIPGKTIEVALEYSEYLEREEGVFEFVYPTVVGPRYENQEEPLTLEEAFAKGVRLDSGKKLPGSFNIKTTVSAPFPVSDVRSASHSILVTTSGNSQVAELSANEQRSGNKDYVLTYSASPNETGAAMLAGASGDEHYFILSIEAPQMPQEVVLAPREYIFLLDVSGSMNGFPMELSKKVMKMVLEKLEPTDRFNVLTFAGGSDSLFPESRAALQENFNRLEVFLRDFSGAGGTEILPAIRTSMQQPSAAGYARSYVILTDGYVTVERDCYDYIRNHVGDANFFAMGIGTSVNRYIIEGIGRAGGGSYEVVESLEGSEEKTHRFIEAIANPVMTDMQLDFQGFEVYDLEPSHVQDLFLRRPIVVTGKIKGEPRGMVEVRGMTGAGPISYKARLDQDNVVDRGEGLSHLWARKKLETISDMVSQQELNERKAEITSLGIEHNMLTQFTAFVAIDSEPSNSGVPPVKIHQPLPLPQGVSNLSVANVVSCSMACVTVNLDEPLLEMDNVFDNEEHLYVAGVEASYPGGQAELAKDLSMAINYPPEAREAGIEGTVYVSFVVSTTGSVRNVQVLRGVNPLLDAEAIRAVRSLKPFAPGSQLGRPVKSRMVIPVKFRLN